MKFRELCTLAFLLQGVFTIPGCQGQPNKPYVHDFIIKPLNADSCPSGKSFFTYPVRAKWDSGTYHTYSQNAQGQLWVMDAENSALLLVDFRKGNVIEITTPFSLKEYRAMMAKNENEIGFLSEEYLFVWNRTNNQTKKIKLTPPKGYRFYIRNAHLDQPVISPGGNFFIMGVWDKKESKIYNFRALDAVVDLNTGKSRIIPIPYSPKTRMGKFTATYPYSREWVDDSSVVYSFVMDEYLYVVNTYTGQIKRVDGTSARQTHIIGPQASASPTDDEYFNYHKYKDYYPRMLYNAARKEYYRIYKMPMPEKNSRGEYNAKSSIEHSIVVFDQNLRRKCEVYMPAAQRYVWRFIPDSNGLYYNLFRQPDDSTQNNRFLGITFD